MECSPSDNKRYDLHCHSTCSDGTDTPFQLLQLAKDKQLAGLSITDHDTVAAYTPEVFALAADLGLKLGVGIELSSRHMDMSVHILGYGFDPAHPAILEFCEKHQSRRYERNLAICIKLEKMGLPIGERWLHDESGKPKKGMGRPHIAQEMLKRGYVTGVRDAFGRYLADHKPAFVLSQFFGVAETIDVIHQSGGKAFIAHPQLIRHKKLIKALLEMPFDGIECFYGNFSAQGAKHWLEIANQKGWLISGGSDYHGCIKPEIPLGASYVSESVYGTIFGI